MLNKESQEAISNIKTVERNGGSFKPLWEEFCKKNAIPVYYTIGWLEFCRCITRENFISDASFLITKDNKPVSICPLIMESGRYGKQFSVKNGHLMRAPAFEATLSFKERKKIEKAVFLHIEELARAEEVLLHRALIDPMLIIDQRFYCNYLSEFSYVDCSILTNIIDLKLPEQTLWGNLRKSYRPLIKGETKKYEVMFLDFKNISERLFAEFENLYFLASGKHVYSRQEWAILCELVRQDKGMLTVAKTGNKAIGGAYFNHDSGKAYYSLGANHPQYEKNYFIGHRLIWEAITYYISRGFRWLELGWQFYPEQLLEKPSEKEINISYFKRGFGGMNFPLHRGIRFFNDEIKKKFIDESLSAYRSGRDKNV
ncbi:MAG: GNAT family N-acetyltransferase [Candidatus Omnitrophica bacterium]|nr:GNAT family N-acetyltransferase [Candidatus Omnitrophota bacterium]